MKLCAMVPGLMGGRQPSRMVRREWLTQVQSFIEWYPYSRCNSTCVRRSGARILVITNSYTQGIIVCWSFKRFFFITGVSKEVIREIKGEIMFMICVNFLLVLFDVLKMKIVSNFIYCMTIYLLSIRLTLCFYDVVNGSTSHGD